MEFSSIRVGGSMLMGVLSIVMASPLSSLVERPAEVDCEEVQLSEEPAAFAFSSAAIEAHRVAKRLARSCDTRESKTRVPAFDVGAGFVFREGPNLGGVPLDVGVEALHRGPFSVRLGMGLTGFRRYGKLDEGPDAGEGWWNRGLNRQLMSTTADVALRVAPVEGLRLEAVSGMLWQSWRQQWGMIDGVSTPILGLGAEATLGSLGIRGRATTDLRPVDLVRSNGSVVRLNPVRVTATVFYRYGGTKRMPSLNTVFQNTGARWRRQLGSLPALRSSLRVVTTEGSTFTGAIEFGGELARKGAFSLETNVGYVGRRDLRLRGPWRSFQSAEVSLDGWVEVGEFLALGASGGLSLRRYSQQFRFAGLTLIPTVGLRTYSPLLRMKSWSIGLDSRTTVDLLSTRLVLDTAEVRSVAPLGVQIGLRFQLGSTEPTPSEG